MTDHNLFMMCKSVTPDALIPIPHSCRIRPCRRDELDMWKAFPFDDPKLAEEYIPFMTDYFNRVYAPQESLFFEKCLFLCDANDLPIATCFAWKVYGNFTTIHWFKTKKSHEGKGLGRALLSEVMRTLKADDYPVYLHTQTSSHRAIKLYTDFGFALLTDEKIGNRINGLTDALPCLEQTMTPEAFNNLRFERSDGSFSRAAALCGYDAF